MQTRGDTFFKNVLFISGISIVVILAAIFLSLLLSSSLSIKTFGIKFLLGREWDPVQKNFGALPFVLGTILTSFLSLIICAPFAIAISLFLGEYFAKGKISTLVSTMIELLAGIPSVIYGFWGLFVIVPLVRDLEIKFNIIPYGVGIFTASIILAIMIIPYAASISREVITMVPSNLKEAAYSLGATKYEVIKKIIIPYCRSGIFASMLLALGRALGETMAVTMVIGNSNDLPQNIFSPSNTMASVIANEFAEASGDIYLSSLIEIALLLLIITFLINIAGKFVLKRLSVV
ncbi:MAG: phosphate ABC transporter permease subunit PstC [Candidatus Schekmanbacteria bacterium]|nr:MAG: phosphate ABC transporter permease subunit PstC [Candidatus Schekmanbacteria bacterium]